MDSKEIQMRLSTNLKKVRKSKKMTQFQLAEKAGVSEETVKNIELCKTWTSDKTLASITEALGIDIFTLFLPSDVDFSNVSEKTSLIKNSISRDIKNYVDEVLNSL